MSRHANTLAPVAPALLHPPVERLLKTAQNYNLETLSGSHYFLRTNHALDNKLSSLVAYIWLKLNIRIPVMNTRHKHGCGGWEYTLHWDLFSRTWKQHMLVSDQYMFRQTLKTRSQAESEPKTSTLSTGTCCLSESLFWANYFTITPLTLVQLYMSYI